MVPTVGGDGGPFLKRAFLLVIYILRLFHGYIWRLYRTDIFRCYCYVLTRSVTRFWKVGGQNLQKMQKKNFCPPLFCFCPPRNVTNGGGRNVANGGGRKISQQESRNPIIICIMNNKCSKIMKYYNFIVIPLFKYCYNLITMANFYQCAAAVKEITNERNKTSEWNRIHQRFQIFGMPKWKVKCTFLRTYCH